MIILGPVMAAGTCSHSVYVHFYLSAAATIKLSTWPSYIHVNIWRSGKITGRHSL